MVNETQKNLKEPQETEILKFFFKKFIFLKISNFKPSAKPSAQKLLPPKQKQKEKKLLPSAEASAFGPPLLHGITTSSMFINFE